MRNALTKVTIALTGLSLLILVSACATNKSFNMKVDVDSFKFDLLDVDSKPVASFSLGETFKVDTSPYVSGLNLLKERLKFTISATGEQAFRKDIGVPKDAKDVSLFLRLKTPDDLNPDIEPPSLRWND